MATRRSVPPPLDDDEVEEVEFEDPGQAGVRSLEPEPEEVEYQGVNEPEPRTGGLTTSGNFFGGAVSEIVEYEPEIIGDDEQTYKIRLTTDIESVFIGIDYQIPPMKKDILYEVSKKVYDYLLPKGLIQGK
jgi:hypothetical protein